MKGDPNPMAFVNVVNLSSRDVEIRRVWFDVDPPVDVRNDSERPLPRRLRPDESWETWIDMRTLPTNKVDDLARVTLSSGKTVKSVARRGLASGGLVPGGLMPG
jgi:hypothetical protein